MPKPSTLRDFSPFAHLKPPSEAEKRLTDQQRLAALLLATNPKMRIKRVGEIVGVTPRTIHTWKAEIPDFRTTLEERLVEQDSLILKNARSSVDKKLIQLCNEGNIKAIALYYQVIGATGPTAGGHVHNAGEVNGIKIVVENRFSRGDEPGQTIDAVVEVLPDGP